MQNHHFDGDIMDRPYFHLDWDDAAHDSADADDHAVLMAYLIGDAEAWADGSGG